ncbi:putative acyl esterase [Scopulibacillus daqui]|uniref:Acyl esterase n=1 Tax=Scopulibacillus daqui TaxID=1469162 RepID=A0ABS2Q2J0_9BACL|nr:CocE/NonD family hydrolase [Scopulibacillus daqui]MBM7645919.1 putative acyl esterase [Scopulibacillus daqui]
MTASIIYERNVPIPMRDGNVIYANVYRPVNDGPHPVLMTFGPYGKDLSLAQRNLEHFNELGGGPFLNWETPNPEDWVPRGYAVVRVDSRGSGASPGIMSVFSERQAQDYYDAIEWAGVQPWSTGKVGLLGISYYAMSMWAVAALQPPHLTAMMPWEGAADIYRDFMRHGGIFNAGFPRFWSKNLQTIQYGADGSVSEEERKEAFVHPAESALAHPFDDEFYRQWLPDLSKIKVPFVSVGNWGNLLLHLRGNTEAYMRASSPHKWLRIIVGDHLMPFYSDEAQRMQERFFGYWLKGEDTGWMEEPPVRLAIRRGNSVSMRDETAWPLPDTQWTRYYLDAESQSISTTAPSASSEFSYQAPEGGVSFSTEPFSEATEITGPVSLRLWVSASCEDMDLFVRIRNLDPDGNDVWGIGPTGKPTFLAQGWLRVSHRKLDPERTLPYRPFHAHDEEQLLQPGEVVPVDVEIWPTSIVFEAGHRLVLEISAKEDPAASSIKDDPLDRPSSRFTGQNTLHTGGSYDSFLLLPVIPKRPSENKGL